MDTILISPVPDVAKAVPVEDEITDPDEDMPTFHVDDDTDDTNADVLFMPSTNGHAKQPDDATPAQLKRCNQLGVRFFGTETWHEQAPKLATEVSKGSVKRIEDLKVVEIEVLMKDLELRITQRAAKLQAA